MLAGLTMDYCHGTYLSRGCRSRGDFLGIGNDSDFLAAGIYFGELLRIEWSRVHVAFSRPCPSYNVAQSGRSKIET